jgi:hypothetical protein
VFRQSVIRRFLIVCGGALAMAGAAAGAEPDDPAPMLGTVVEYDRVNQRVINRPEFNQYISPEYREGYEV